MKVSQVRQTEGLRNSVGAAMLIVGAGVLIQTAPPSRADGVRRRQSRRGGG